MRPQSFMPPILHAPRPSRPPSFTPPILYVSGDIRFERAKVPAS